MGELRPKITYLSPFIPFPSIPHAGGQFLYRFVERLSVSFDITVVAPASERNRAGAAEAVPAKVHLIPIRQSPRTQLGYVPRLLANTVAGVSPGWQVLWAFRRHAALWDLVRASDLVELEWAWYLPFVGDVRRVAPGIPVVAFEYDVLAESLTRRAQGGQLHERTLGRIAAARARHVEPALLAQCDAVFTFSGREKSLLAGMGVQTPVQIVCPLVERREAVEPRAERPAVLLVGAMDRAENHEAASWLATEVWPSVEQRRPDARLVLAGTSPPPALQRLASGSVEVTGYVADLDALYRAASVVVAPPLTGAGVKFKVLDALSYGLPVVATPIGAEGIAEGTKTPGFAAVTADPATMAEALIMLLDDPKQAREIGLAGRAWVRSTYDFDASVAAVAATYERLIARNNSA